jgi:hypothetical protein
MLDEDVQREDKVRELTAARLVCVGHGTASSDTAIVMMIEPKWESPPFRCAAQ